jgi:hypothetical protein
VRTIAHNLEQHNIVTEAGPEALTAKLILDLILARKEGVLVRDALATSNLRITPVAD